MDFKLIKTYHKPYRIFSEDYVINIGNVSPVQLNQQNINWLNENMTYCFSGSDKFYQMNSEWSIWYDFINNNIVQDDSIVTFQHYSKILDLNSVNEMPYHDITQIEDTNGEKYRQCKSLDDFGYNKVDDLFSKYDIVVGNQYPCNICLSIKANMNISLNSVLDQYRNIIYNFDDNIFTVKRLEDYCNSKYQYWRGGPILTTAINHKKLLDFTIKFEHAFLDSKDYQNQSIYKNRDGRGNGYIGEMVMGFAIYCLVDEYKKHNKKIGYCRLFTDSSVIFGNTQK